ncbi:beta-CASP ribonuclease aCPSF1 [Thermogladius sp. 4427co]|uniref:beta-CASP ribonuclease aCPSF1 n=1 Tax=Thermogladius sp. 4427co TaxID=3450718 RepID=UPI003F7A4809
MTLPSDILDKNRKSLVESLLKEIPPELNLSSIEFEGPEIVLYVNNRQAIIKYFDTIKNIAKKIRKRVVVRVSPDARLPPEEARKKILELVPKDANVDPNNIIFDETLGEVWIKAEKPGAIIGKGNIIRHFILSETGWRPVPLRASPLESKMLNAIMSNLLKQSKYRLDFLRRVGERIHRDVIFKNNYVRVTALGGFMEVGRSAILVETRESRILLDLGINVGALNDPNRAYPILDLDSIRVDELDAIIVTHAHLDHVGLVPLLYKYGYRGPTYMTRPTRELAAIMIQDLIRVSRREGRELLFGEKDLSTMILHTITVEYDEVTDVAPDIKLTMYNAGHILGSAIVHLHIGMGLHNIVYTGDFKYTNTRLLDRAVDEFPRVETLIMESTYGATKQQSRMAAEQQLVDIVKKTIERKGIVLIPVFAVGRGQEIMIVLNEAINRKLIPPVNIYIEGLINEVTAIHTEYPEYMSRSLRDVIYRGENPFTSDYFKIIEGDVAKPDIVEDRPSIIIATSGMLTGGPAVDYLKLIAGDEKSSLVFVGYQSEGTLGRKIKDGMREIPTVTEGRVEILKINLEVYSIDGFSGHSDQTELVKYALNIKPKPKNIILNHGEPEAIHTLARILSRAVRDPSSGYSGTPNIYTPSVLDSINLTAPR